MRVFGLFIIVLATIGVVMIGRSQDVQAIPYYPVMCLQVQYSVNGESMGLATQGYSKIVVKKGDNVTFSPVYLGVGNDVLWDGSRLNLSDEIYDEKDNDNSHSYSFTEAGAFKASLSFYGTKLEYYGTTDFDNPDEGLGFGGARHRLVAIDRACPAFDIEAKDILPPPINTTWQTSYWNLPFGHLNTPAIPGRPADVTAQHEELDFEWCLNESIADIQPDQFIVRATKTIVTDGNEGTITTRSDDGIRVFVDGNLWINEWNDHGTTTHNATGPLSAGAHEVVIEYYENGWDAVLEVDLTGLPILLVTTELYSLASQECTKLSENSVFFSNTKILGEHKFDINRSGGSLPANDDYELWTVAVPVDGHDTRKWNLNVSARSTPDYPFDNIIDQPRHGEVQIVKVMDVPFNADYEGPDYLFNYGFTVTFRANLSESGGAHYVGDSRVLPVCAAFIPV